MIKGASEANAIVLDDRGIVAGGTLAIHGNQMANAGAQGTPFLVFRNGGKWYSLEGLPTDLKAFVGGLEKP